MPDRLASGVYCLELGWPAPFGANAYLVDDGAVTLIDAGLPLNGSGIRRELAALDVPPSAIDRVLITHYDLDHVGGLSRLVPELDAPVYMGAADIDLATGTWAPPLFHHKGLFHRGLRAIYRLPGALTLRPVRDGDDIGGFTAFHTPGHNPGHTVYVNESMELALLGDLVWEDDGLLTIPFWLDSYDMRELRASVRRLATEAPPFEIAAMGHGTPIRSGGTAALRTLVDRLDEASD